MSRLQVHHDVMMQLNELGVTEAMLLQCTDEQVGSILDAAQDDTSGGNLPSLVMIYINYNKENPQDQLGFMTDEQRRNLNEEVAERIANNMRSNTMTCPENVKLLLREAMNNGSDMVMTKDQWDHVAQCESCSAIVIRIKEENQMTKSRTVGHVAGSVVGTATDKVVRGGIATKAWWDTDGKAATIATGRTMKRGILGTMRAIKDVAQGAAQGAKASYNANKATRK